MPPKSNFLDKVLNRIGRIDSKGLHTVVERLASERSFLETLFNTIEDGVLVVDSSGQILYFNEAVTRLIGLNPDDAEGRSLANYLPQLDWTTLLDLNREKGRRVARQEFEVEYPRPRYLRLYASPLDDGSGVSAGLALILHDATEARQKTFEAIESERLQALTLLAASVAHEIGNPLNALHLHLQLMEREIKNLRRQPGRVAKASKRQIPGLSLPANDAESDETAAIVSKLDQYLDVCKGEIDRLDYIITQFLKAIRPSPPQMKPVVLNDVVKKTLELLGPELENRGINVREKCARNLPEASLDPSKLEQVLVNLVKNAMQAMTRGGVLTLETGESSDGIWVSIGDTGGGIPQEQINRIFEPFFTTKAKGSGLGLMIVQRIVRDHKGRIEVESNMGRGTTFRIWLPLTERRTRLLGGAGSSSHSSSGGEAAHGR